MILFEIIKIENDRYVFKLYDNSNNLIALSSNSYYTHDGCLDAFNIIRNKLNHCSIKYDEIKHIGHFFDNNKNFMAIKTRENIDEDEANSISAYCNKFYLNIKYKKD